MANKYYCQVRVKDQFTTAKSEFSYMSSERREQERSSRKPVDSSSDSSNPPSPAQPHNQLKIEQQQKQNGHYSKVKLTYILSNFPRLKAPHQIKLRWL